MQKRKILTLINLLLVTTKVFAGYTAHEWGTFTSLVGSNGITVNGMYHEDEILPEFVHGFGETQTIAQPLPRPEPTRTTHPDPTRPRPCRGKACFDDAFYEQNSITQKMETPVIYFYGDAQSEVEVNVKFPDGLITETFPAPVMTYPLKSQMPVLGNGNTTFKVQVLDTIFGNLPYVDFTNIYSHARRVASNVVKTGSEYEKFIFYRGLGRFQPRIRFQSINGSLNLSVNISDAPQSAFLIDVNQAGHANMKALNDSFTERHFSSTFINMLQNHDMKSSKSIVVGNEAIRSSLIYALKRAGLNEDEAVAMLNTWEHGYLKVPGLRMLYILPRTEVDQILPLTMKPAPELLERVFVGRIEIMLDTEENAILQDILVQGIEFDVKKLGRFSESKLRRVLDVYRSNVNAVPGNIRLIEDLVNKAAQLGNNG